MPSFKRRTLNVHLVAAVQSHTFVLHGQVNLPLKLESSQRQLMAKAVLVSRLQEPRPQFSMDLDRSSQDRLGNLVLSPHLSDSAVSFLPFSYPALEKVLVLGA